MSSSSSGTFAPGAEFGPYTIRRQVGRGAFGIVYEALRNPLKRRVALKVLHEHVLSTPDAITRFQREIMTAAQVEHPHVVQVFDGGVKDERGFLAMEFLEGETLGERLKRDKHLRVEEVMDILLPIASALDAVHNAGIVHRDIKPGNIFLASHVTGITSPRLVDFGIAKLVSDELDLTQTHSWLGTPFYMSPEQVRQSKSIDARADQWSLGVVLYEALTGDKPFRSDVLLDLLEAITSRTPAVPSSLQSSIPKGLDTVIAKMMERDPVRRYASMRAVGSALWPFASPRTRALWAKHFDRENDPGAKLDDVMEARDSGFVGNATEMGKTTVHAGDETTLAKTTVRAETSAAAPSSVAWSQVAMGAAAGVLAMFVGQRVMAPTAPTPTAEVAPATAPHVPVPEVAAPIITPPPTPDVAVAAPVVAPDAAVVAVAPAAVDAAVPNARPSVATTGAPAAAPAVRGAPYCDDDPAYREACAALQRGDRAAAVRAFQGVRGPRALVALAHLYRQSGRLVDAEEKIEQALRDGGDAWMSSHTSFTNSLLNEVQGRLGTITIDCAHGEAVVGGEGASRRYTLPRGEPIRSPVGHVQVVITHNGISFQQYVDVRSGQTARVTSCGAGG
jgi:hypothetical protein